MVKLTKQRKTIYDIFKNSEKPLNAEMIYEMFEKDTINLSTVYRTIDYFENNNLLLKFHFNGKLFYFLNSNNHHHYFICTNCLKMYEVDCNLTETLNDLKNKHNFLVTNHEITVYGICSKCQEINNGSQE